MSIHEEPSRTEVERAERIERRKQKNIALFSMLEHGNEDPLVRMLAHIAREVIVDQEGIGICYLNSATIVKTLMKERILPSSGTAHYWYGKCPHRPTPHGVAVMKVPDRLYFIDTVGRIDLRLFPGIVSLGLNDTHPIFGNPHVKQTMTTPLTPEDLKWLNQSIGMPILINEREISCVADFFTMKDFMKKDEPFWQRALNRLPKRRSY